MAMSGSGPALFSLFGTVVEAADAVAEVAGARSAEAVAPVDRGWEIDGEVPLPQAPWMSPS